MWHVLYFTFTMMLPFFGASAHQSFRIAAMTRGLDIDNPTPETIGGSSHHCYRKCVAGDVRTCVYSFTISEYTTMSRLCGDCPYSIEDCYNNGCITAGGYVRHVTIANHMLPGPSIQVCEGDIIQVDVINALSSDSTGIHWHGLHQIGTPYMDGVPYLTQCPIHPNTKFKYNFTANPAGTHIWHSHSGFQEADGLYGSVVVRVADDPLSQFYDYDLSEHIMTLWHWFNASAIFIFKTMPPRRKPIFGHCLTINGLAATVKYERDGIVHMTPSATFTVTQGYRYRFRLQSNVAIYCPIQVSVDNHTMLLIASDGAPFEPIEVDTLIISAGERYDFVIKADQEIKNYWIRYQGLGICGPPRARVSGEAILRYDGADKRDPPEIVGFENAKRSGLLLNPVDESSTDYSSNELIYMTDLNNTMSGKVDISGRPDHIIYLEYGFNDYSELHPPNTYPQFNNISFELPHIPFLTQYDEITDDMYCTDDDESAKKCFGSYCTCPYIYAVAADSLVEMVIVDMQNISDGNDNHPFHLHGHYFHVVAMEKGNQSKIPNEVRNRNEAGLIDKKFHRAPIKDTIGVPAHGFVVLRFIADNPGYWFFHCHILDHLEEGMAVVIKVGEHGEMAQPPDSFPTCRNREMRKTYNSKSSSYSFMVASKSGLMNLVIFAITYTAYARPLAFIFGDS